MKDLRTPSIAAKDPSANPSSGPPTRAHIAIIDGGASGVLMAVHLLRQPNTARVMLIERSGAMGAGVAYITADPRTSVEHLRA